MISQMCQVVSGSKTEPDTKKAAKSMTSKTNVGYVGFFTLTDTYEKKNNVRAFDDDDHEMSGLFEKAQKPDTETRHIDPGNHLKPDTSNECGSPSESPI